MMCFFFVVVRFLCFVNMLSEVLCFLFLVIMGNEEWDGVVRVGVGVLLGFRGIRCMSLTAHKGSLPS